MENTGIIENNRTQMRRGVLEYSILLILASGDEYASSIIQKLKDVNIIVVEGTTYPLLTRLKNMGLLNYRWEESPRVFGEARRCICTEVSRDQIAVCIRIECATKERQTTATTYSVGSREAILGGIVQIPVALHRIEDLCT